VVLAEGESVESFRTYPPELAQVAVLTTRTKGF
jgi:hypothetical protein